MTDPVNSIDFDTLPRNLDIAAMEKRWQLRWQELGISARDRLQPREKSFVVDSPPPTVSGSLHVGHVFSYTHQDLIVRHKRMNGWNIAYPMGWDDNGLPTERRVQNYFNVRAEPGIPYDPDLEVEPVGNRKNTGRPISISRQNFIELCQIVTAQDELVFKDLWQRLGLSIDWSEEYATIDERCRRIAQRSFRDLYDKGHIFQDEAPTMWDVDFRTAVAQAEVEDRERTSAFYDLEFGVAGGGAFTISTTRPELLAACVGVTAHPDDSRFRELFGKTAMTPAFFAPVPIFPSELADPEKGTGVLMVCTFGDQTDVEWWRAEGLQLRHMIGHDGRILDRTFGQQGWDSARPDTANANYARLVGKRVTSARREMTEMLADPSNSAAGGRAPLIRDPRPTQQVVRYYEKGDSPLEYLTSRQWFVRLLDKKDKLAEMGRRIRWSPRYMQKRYENWTENLNTDWSIGRQRYFGVPIPVWYPLDESGNRDYAAPIVAPPDRLPVDPMTDSAPGFSESERDRPGGFTGEPDVFDTWFTSSLSPQIVARWGDPDEQMDRLFPMDMRPQAHDIIRTWAFYTIAKAMLHHDDIPWRNVVISGFVVDPDRKKMSKSKGNVVTPVDLLDKYGADAVRYWAARARLGTDTIHDEKVFRVGKRLVTKIYNASKFVLSQAGPAGSITNELDKGFVAEMREVVDWATGSFEEFEFAAALETIESFFWGSFTDNYIELAKRRARDEADPAGQSSAIATLRLGLSVCIRLFAPYVPSIADEVWSWVFAKETGVPSVHIADWPTKQELQHVEAPSDGESFRSACDAIAAVRKAKSERSIGLGKPLAELRFKSGERRLGQLELVLSDVLSASGAASAQLAPFPEASDTSFVAEIKPLT